MSSLRKHKEGKCFCLTGLHPFDTHDLLWLEGNTVDLIKTPIKCHVQRRAARDKTRLKLPDVSPLLFVQINSEDDRGVLKGNWSGDFKQGVSPSAWTGSGDILRMWAVTGYSPVKYGQCWVFAAVMCTGAFTSRK